jgi:hypothetical protein
VFNFLNLDARTRAHMMDEFDYDTARDKLYYSRRFTDQGRKVYQSFMRAAIENGTEGTLADALNRGECMTSTALRLGAPVSAPCTAAQTFADGEFNRFYARAVCLRASDDGTNNVTVYRAKEVENPRAQSISLIGRRFPASTLLDDLRVNLGVETALGLAAPNSGLSIFCDCGGCAAA